MDAIDIAINELKTRARVLHRAAQQDDPAARERIAKLPKPPEVGAVQRKHCLDIVSREAGFRSWQHAQRLVQAKPGSVPEADFGTLLYGPRCGGLLNQWFRNYDEARAFQTEQGGTLLGYKTQCLVVGPHYLRALGLDPDDERWERMGHDWVQPQDVAARQELYGELIARQQPRAA